MVQYKLSPVLRGYVVSAAIASNRFELPATDWRSTLTQIPTVFGRLEYLAGLRDEQTGCYQDPAQSAPSGNEDTDRALRHSHHQVFSQWLRFNLAAQKSDLDEYLRLSGSLRVPRYYRTFVPAAARDVERQLYITDLETLLELVRCERAGDVLLPVASPRQSLAR